MTASKQALPVYRARVGALLKALRVSRGVTLKQIGDRCGYQTGAVDRMEMGHFAASPEMLEAYRDALGGTESGRVTNGASMSRKLQRAARAGLIPKVAS